MPGIHVRTISQLDWIEQEKESILNVPGSYWLCYKKHIYKFTFKYHHTVRDPTEFSYVRELMKVIRKIIKCPPHQGQLFGTKHLLVTYNHTSWTRQDKMFAILKFHERSNATAYSHAFVLTVKILSSPEIAASEKSMIINNHDFNENINSASKCINLKKNEEKTFVHTPINVLPDRGVDSKNEMNQQLDTSNINFNKTPNLQNDFVTQESCIKDNNQIINISEENKKIPKSNPVNCGLTKTKRIRRKSEIDPLTVSPAKVQKIQEEQSSNTFKKTDNKKKLNVNELPSLDRFNFEQIHADKDIRKDVNLNNTVNDEGAMDSANLPYQYLIEKEIEDAKNKTITQNTNKKTGGQFSNKEILDGRKYTEEDNFSPPTVSKIQDTEKHIDSNDIRFQDSGNTKSDKNDRQKQKNKESEKKNIPEEKSLRFSNITDLVMEGLMFTIREDQDSVAVIEQKTKLEIDEVLENSEKVETYQGEKCFLNSSLLGLENLVTMIEMPETDMEEGETGSIKNEEILKAISYIDEYSASDINDEEYNEETYEDDISDIKGEEEDIIPEALQQEFLEERATACEEYHSENLLTDSDLLLPGTNIFTGANPKFSSNAPRIISNEIITVDQIPMALQKFLKNKSLKNQSIVNNENDVSDCDTTAHDTEFTTLSNSVESVVDNSTFTEVNTSTLALETSHTAISQTSVTREKSLHDESTCSSIQRNNIKPNKIDSHENKKDTDKETDVRLKLEKKSTISRRSHFKQKNFLLSNELQDITEDFHRDLLHIQMKNRAIDHRRLRQRKLLNNTAIVKNNQLRIEMLKFMQDITRGVKVVVNRISTNCISSMIGKNSSLAKQCTR